MHGMLMGAKDPQTGTFSSPPGAYSDLQDLYCAVATASALNIMTPALLEGIDRHLVSCQSYEGGIGAVPGGEAHGAYTYLGVATAILAGCLQKLDCMKLLVRSIAVAVID